MLQSTLVGLIDFNHLIMKTQKYYSTEEYIALKTNVLEKLLKYLKRF